MSFNYVIIEFSWDYYDYEAPVIVGVSVVYFYFYFYGASYNGWDLFYAQMMCAHKFTKVHFRCHSFTLVFSFFVDYWILGVFEFQDPCNVYKRD